jgi:hypothetical protein
MLVKCSSPQKAVMVITVVIIITVIILMTTEIMIAKSNCLVLVPADRSQYAAV